MAALSRDHRPKIRAGRAGGRPDRPISELTQDGERMMALSLTHAALGVGPIPADNDVICRAGNVCPLQASHDWRRGRPCSPSPWL